MSRLLFLPCLFACTPTPPPPPPLTIELPTARSAEMVPLTAIGCDGSARIDMVDHGLYFDGAILEPARDGLLLEGGTALATALEASSCMPKAAWLRADGATPLSTIAEISRIADEAGWRLAAVVDASSGVTGASPPVSGQPPEVVEIAPSAEGRLARTLSDSVDIVHLVAPESGRWSGLVRALDTAATATPCLEIRFDEVKDAAQSTDGGSEEPRPVFQSRAPAASSLAAFEWPAPERDGGLPRWNSERRTLLSGTECPGSGIDLQARTSARAALVEQQRAEDAPVLEGRETRNALLDRLTNTETPAPAP